MYSSHIITRDHSSKGNGGNGLRRSVSQDFCAGSTHNLFSFLTATVRSKYNRFDDFEGDVDEDEAEENLDDGRVGVKDEEEKPAEAVEEEAASDGDDDGGSLHTVETAQSKLEESVQSLMQERPSLSRRSTKNSKLQETRANALTDKLRKQLQLDDSTKLVSGKSTQFHQESPWGN